MHTHPIAMQEELEPGVKGPICGRWIQMAVVCGRTALLIVDEALSHVIVFLCISDG